MERSMIIISASVFITLVLGVALIWAIWRPDWLGFADKSLWDWLAILAFPTVLGFATFLIAAVQEQIERDRTSENALQLYFSRISELALDERLESRKEVAGAIGRAETLAILHLVEGDRAGRALAFLSEMGLLQTFEVEFEGLDLSGAELKGLNLEGVDFEASELTGADLEDARLRGGDFEDAILVNADFKETDLREASFEGAVLNGAEFRGADMRGALLSEAKGLEEKQLSQSCLDETTELPASFAPVEAPTAACREIDDN